MRPLYILILFAFLTACGTTVPSVPTQVVPEEPAVLPFLALMQAPDRWSGRRIMLIAPLFGGPGARVLGPALSTAGKAPAPIDDPRGSLWLASLLPASIASKATGGAIYLKLRGRLSPPGAYGRDARFTYQFAAESIGVLEPERTTLENLAENPRAIDGVILQVAGTLLAGTSDALLVDEMAAGGVPAKDARQIKVRNIPPQALERLQQQGQVRYGAVEITGWWQGGTLVPFLIAQK